MTRSGIDSETGGPSERKQSRKPRRVTMQDVADRAGVHQTTVSIALRNHPSLPQETCRRIQAFARELGYRKDPELDAFNRYRVHRQGDRSDKRIALVSDCVDECAFHSHAAFGAYFAGAKEEANRLNYDLELVIMAPEEREGPALNDRLKRSGFSALLIGGMTKRGALPLKLKEWPAVAIDAFELEFELDVFAPDYRRAARRSVVELHALGYRRIGYFASKPCDEQLGNLCHVGYLIEARMKGLPTLVDVVKGRDESDAELFEWVAASDLDAVICLENRSCEAFSRLATTTGRPLAVCSLDWRSGSSAIPGVDLRRAQVGEAAVRCLVEKRLASWRNASRSATVTYMPTDWVSVVANIERPLALESV